MQLLFSNYVSLWNMYMYMYVSMYLCVYAYVMDTAIPCLYGQQQRVWPAFVASASASLQRRLECWQWRGRTHIFIAIRANCCNWGGATPAKAGLQLTAHKVVLIGLQKEIAL